MVEYMGCFMRFYGVYVGEWPYFKGKMCRYEEAAGLLACAFGLEMQPSVVYWSVRPGESSLDR